MIVNNYEEIKRMLSFDSDDIFYFVQILRRKKENPDEHSNSRVIKTYYIYSLEQLEREFPEMVMLSKFHNARVYINLNKRSFERMAFHNLKKTADCIMNKDYKSVRKSYPSVCGEYMTGDKRWIIDIDVKDELVVHEYIKLIRERLNEDRKMDIKTLYLLDTVNGYHIISYPFDTYKFNIMCEVNQLKIVDIHKNNPTLLYYNNEGIN